MMTTCPIHNHHHEVTLVRTVVQRGTKAVARVWQCPTGRYRWFEIDDRAPIKLTRPRWGWRKP